MWPKIRFVSILFDISSHDNFLQFIHMPWIAKKHNLADSLGLEKVSMVNFTIFLYVIAYLLEIYSWQKQKNYVMEVQCHVNLNFIINVKINYYNSLSFRIYVSMGFVISRLE